MAFLGWGRYLTSVWVLILASIALTFAEGLRAKKKKIAHASFTKISGGKLEYVVLQCGAMQFTFVYLCLFSQEIIGIPI